MNEMVIQTPADIEAEVPAIVAWSQSLRITTAEQYAAVCERRSVMKGMLTRIAAFFKPMKQKQDEAKKAILDAEKKLLVPVQESYDLVGKVLLTWDNEQKEIAEQQRRRLQAIADEQARKEREVIEQAAAKQRAIEAEQRAKADAARRAAEEATAAERKRLLAQAEVAERKAAAAVAQQEAKAEQAAAVIAPVVQVTSVAPKVAGTSVRKSWSAEVVDVSAFLAHVFDTRRADLVIPNDRVLQAYAKAMKSEAKIPGCRFVETSTMASTGR